MWLRAKLPSLNPSPLRKEGLQNHTFSLKSTFGKCNLSSNQSLFSLHRLMWCYPFGGSTTLNGEAGRKKEGT